MHEILSRAPGADVPFAEVVKPLVRMAEEGMSSPDRPVRFGVEGDGGQLPARVATPLAVVLNELLQNAVDHAFPPEDGAGEVVVRTSTEGDDLVVQVVDDGVGVPPGFDIEAAASLGLSIVRSLVTTQLGGTITVRRGDPGGTVVELRLPVPKTGEPA